MKKKILLPILLLAAMSITGCGKQPVSSSEPGGDVSSQEPASTEEPVSSEDPTVYGVAIANKAALQDGWYAGTNRDLDVTLTPAANALQELGKGNLKVTSSNAEVVKVSGLGLAALKEGTAKITVEYHNAKDEVEVTILDPSAKGKYGAAHEGTAEDPFTNEDALLVAKHEKYEGEVYYVKGKVASFYNAPGSRTDGMVAYFLEPATAGGEKFEIYKCFKEDGSPLTDDDIWVGGEATAYGAFTLYGTQYETSSAKFVKCEGNKPQPRTTLSKTFAETLAMGQALPDGGDTYDYIKFTGFVTAKSGNNYWLTATKGEALIAGKSDAAHGERDIYTNGIELYNAGKVAALVAKLLEGAEVEVTMLVKNYHGTVENGLDLKDEDVTLKTPGTQWAVPEPEVGTRTLKEFIDGENTKAKAYLVTGTIKSWKDASSAKDKYGNMVLTDGTNDLIIYGATATASALVWDNSSSYAFTNPQDFLTNDVTAALSIGNEITMKLIRADYGGKVEGSGIITAVTPVEATAIALNKTTAEIEVEGSVTLEATLTPANANSPITWISSDEAVATVAAGVVTGVAAGTATITAKVSDTVKAECVVTVKAPAAGVLKATLKYNGTENKTCANFEGDALTEILNLNKDIFTVTYDKNGATSEMALRTDGIRMYATKQTTNGNKITVSIASGYKIKDVNIAYDTNYSATSVVSAGSTAVTAVDGVYAINGSSFTVFNDNSGVSSNTQVRFQKIDITYEEAGSVTPTPAEVVLPIIAKGNQDTKVEGAGAWIYINTTGLSLTAEMANAMAAAAQIQLTVAMSDETPDGVKDAAQHYITGADAAVVLDGTVRFDDFGTNTVRLYVGMDKGLDNSWKMKHTFQISIPLDATTVFVGSVEFVGGALTKINDEPYVAPVVIAQPTGTFFASVEITDAGKTALSTTNSIVPVFITLGTGTASVSVNGVSAGACTLKQFDQSNGWLVITTASFGDISMQYNPENGRLEKLSVLANTGILKYDGGQSLRGNDELHYWNCDGTDSELQADFNRRSGNSSWSLDSETDRIVKNTEHAISGSAMQVNKKSDSKERIALSLKDFAQPFNARNISFWVYNDGESSVNLQAFYYKQANYGGYQQIFSGKAVAAGQWTYVSVGFTAADVYAFQIVIPQGTASTLIFDDICLF